MIPTAYKEGTDNGGIFFPFFLGTLRHAGVLDFHSFNVCFETPAF